MNNKKAKDLSQQKKKEINNLVSKLIKHQKALYHPETRMKLFIYDGICCKGECNTDKEERHLKVLLPAGSFGDFQDPIKLDRVGKAVVCFQHFFFKHQKEYIINGQFPEEARLKRGGENFDDYEIKAIPAPKPFKTKKDKSGRYVTGFKLLKGAAKDNAWVCNFHKFAQFKNK
jgi:hypothetical protein